jgi:hypothetical protein
MMPDWLTAIRVASPYIIQETFMNLHKNTPYRPAALAAALSLILASSAFAADPYRPTLQRDSSTSRQDTQARQDMQSRDQNQNLSQSDAFSNADANQDGKLSQSEYQTLMRQQSAMQGSTPASGALASLGGKRVDQLKGLDVLNRNGTKIGKVDKVVQSNHDSQMHVVVSVGGFLGIFDTEITMPLKELAWRDGNLIAPTTASKEQLKERRNYSESAYRELSGEQTISQYGQAGSQTTLSFESLDRNKDGDIDRSEFSAFESGEPLQSPGSGATPNVQDWQDRTK